MMIFPDDYGISRKEVWTILKAAFICAVKAEDWQTAGAMSAALELAMELPEFTVDKSTQID